MYPSLVRMTPEPRPLPTLVTSTTTGWIRLMACSRSFSMAGTGTLLALVALPAWLPAASAIFAVLPALPDGALRPPVTVAPRRPPSTSNRRLRQAARSQGRKRLDLSVCDCIMILLSVHRQFLSHQPELSVAEAMPFR